MTETRIKSIFEVSGTRSKNQMNKMKTWNKDNAPTILSLTHTLTHRRNNILISFRQ